jgi:DNA repair protein RecO
MHRSSQTCTALVLKRSNTRESERVVTLITQEHGKMVCIAKGAQKLTSSKIAALEPGNVIKASLIRSHETWLLTQAIISSDTSVLSGSLPKMRQLFQLLEFLQHLLVEEELPNEVFSLVLALRNAVVNPTQTTTLFYQLFDELLVELGYMPFDQSKHQSLTAYVAEITEKKLKTWEFLKTT